MTDFIFLGSRITVDAVMKFKDTHSLKGKLCQNYIAYYKAEVTWPTNGRIVKTIVFPVVMCSGSTREDASRGSDASEPWCWRILLIVPRRQGDQTASP